MSTLTLVLGTLVAIEFFYIFYLETIATASSSTSRVFRMSKDELPPARAFWSTTLYDSANGFFIPNDRKKYSVGENAGMKLNSDGGIAIYIAAEKPSGVPEENWLPINRQDEALDVILRIYAPDQERFATWTAPTAEKLMAASR